MQQRTIVGGLHDDVARGEHGVIVVDQHCELLLHADRAVLRAPREVHEHAAARTGVLLEGLASGSKFGLDSGHTE